MNRPKGVNNNLNITDNAECRCFDKTTAQEHYFLLKNSSQKDITSSPKPKLHQNTTNPNINTSSSKKSLKKQKQRVYYNKSPEPTKRTYHQYYSNGYEEKRADRKEGRQIPLQYTERSIENRSSIKELGSRQNELQIRPQLAMKSVSTQILPSSINFNRTIVPITQFVPIKTVETHQPKILQLHFSPRMYASAQKLNFESIPQTPRYKMQGLITPNPKVREQMKTEPQTSEKIQSQLTLNILQRKQIKQARVLSDRATNSKLLSFNIKDKDRQMQSHSKRPEQQISFYKQEPMKPVIRQQPFKSKIAYDNNKLQIPTFQSKYDTRKSCVDDGTGRSKITLKKVKNNAKPRLKKMDDVQEIKSMIDSQEMISDDDKQSVVLAKLNQYGSLVDTKLSAVDSRPITFMSKVAYQSTTAQKSMVKNYDYINFK